MDEGGCSPLLGAAKAIWCVFPTATATQVAPKAPAAVCVCNSDNRRCTFAVTVALAILRGGVLFHSATGNLGTSRKPRATTSVNELFERGETKKNAGP